MKVSMLLKIPSLKTGFKSLQDGCIYAPDSFNNSVNTFLGMFTNLETFLKDFNSLYKSLAVFIVSSVYFILS